VKTIAVFLILTSTLHADWLEKRAQGWAWYEEEEKKEYIEVEPQKLSPKERLEEQKNDLENKLAEAILEPSEENMKSYMLAQQKVVEQSSIFASAWTQQLLASPSLDNTIKNPTTQYGIQASKTKLFELKKEAITNLSKSHGLFFFFEGKDVVSQQLSYVVSLFQKIYGWDVMPISVDHTPAPAFKDFKNDEGITDHLGVDVFPSIFAVEPSREEIIPIAFGAISLDQLEDRVFSQLHLKKKESEDVIP
jgi:conjugal transfer pilus assembly protein TraF